ncbi:MAG: hypothetical protein QF824_01915, partial [Candidatus Woesearchaeota archaeon]|nr:hypothetical protein [Candidatus Woesearchaeota archaeon]
TSYTDDSLTILNITNKSGPKPVGDYSDSEPPYSLDGAWDVFVEGDFAYVTSYDDDSLTVLNVSDKSNPFPVGSYGNYSALPYSLEQANAVHVLDGYAYVSSSVDDSINVIDIDTYLPAGIYTSQIFDLGFIGIWQNISWVNVSEPRTNVTFQVRSCNDVDCEGETLVGPDNTNSSYFNNNLQGNLSGVGNITDNQYVQYRAFFVTNNSLFTSVLENVTIFYIADSLKPTISLLNPGDGLNTTNTSINFNWTAVDNSDLNLSCNLTINSLVNVSGIESANNTPTNMTVGGFGDGTYRWNVTCLDNSSNSNTSSTNIFTVDTTAPFVGLISPSNISWVNTRNVTFNFTLDELLPDVCWLYVNASDTWTSVVNNTDPVNGKNNLTYNLSDGAYIWNVWCNDSMGFSAFNESNLTFFVDTIFPNITNENRTPTAVYTNSTLRLNVTVVDDRGLDTIWVEGNWSGSLVNYTNLSEIGSGFNITVNLSYLLNQKLVGWRVYANDSAGNLNTSPLRTFFVNNLGLPPTPNLTSPVNNSVVVFDSATFEWVRPTDPDNDNLTYDILVSRNVTFTDIEANITLINNTESYNINGAYNLTKGTRYWKVRAKDLVNYSNYSDYWQITVVEAVINLTSPANNTIFYPGNATNITIKEERGNEWVNNVIVQIDGTNYTAVNDTDSSNDIDWYYLYTLPSTSPKVINITSIGYNNTVNETVTHDLQLVLSKLNSSLPTVDYVCSNATYAINNTQSKISFKTALDTIAKKTNVSIVTPSGDIFELNLSSTNKLNLTYTYDYFYKLDEVGNYTLKANITDVEGNSTVYNYTFVSYANTTGTDTINLTSIGTTSTKLLDVCGENVLYNGTFVLNRTILAGSKYDVKFETADPIIIFNSVGLNGTYALALNYTNIAKSITAPSGKRVVIEFELKSNFTTQDNITIIYNYSSIVSALDDEDGLVMYKCDSQSDCSWSLISSTVDAAENIITGTTGNLSVFLVAETAVTTTTVTADAVGGGGGGGGGVGGRNLTLPVGLDLISNEPFEMVTDDTITIDIVAKNIGKLSLHNIALSAISNSSNVGVSLENSLIERLRGGEENDVTLTLKSLGEEGRYKITVNAEVERPELNASTDIYFDIRKRGYVNRTIILTRIEFAKDLFKENPECLELEEVLRNAEDALAEDNLADAALLMNSAVQSCRDLIAAKEDGVAWLPSPLRGISVNEWIIFVIELLVVIVIMVIAVRYYMRRRALI